MISHYFPSCRLFSRSRGERAGARGLWVICVVWVVYALSTLAADKPQTQPSKPASKAAADLEDAYDLLYLAKPRPSWFRLHIRAGGQPFSRLLDQYFDAFFKYLDVNGDG